MQISKKNRTFAVQEREKGAPYNSPYIRLIWCETAIWHLKHKRYYNMETKVYVSEVKESAKCSVALEVLNAYKVALLKESKDSKLLDAAKALETAKAAYQKAANNVVLGDSEYNNLQTECVRSAVSEFAHTHQTPNFATWFDDNGKDTQIAIIDTPQKLGSHLKELHESFAKGAKVARKRAKTARELRAEALALLAQANQLEGKE